MGNGHVTTGVLSLGVLDLLSGGSPRLVPLPLRFPLRLSPQVDINPGIAILLDQFVQARHSM